MNKFLTRRSSSVFALAFFTADCDRINNPAQNSTVTNSSQTNTAQTNSGETNREVPTAPVSNAVVSYSAVVKRAAPAVVTITSGQRVSAGRLGGRDGK